MGAGHDSADGPTWVIRLWRWDRRKWAACIAAVSAAWMAMLGAREAVVGLADLRAGLALGFDEGSWLASVYAAGDVIGVVLGCWLATALSLRRVLLGASLLHALASCLLAIGPTFFLILGARGLQGLAAGALLPMAIVALLRTLAPRHRPLALAIYTSASTLAPPLAVGLTGWLLEHFSWPALFWSNAPLAVLALLSGAYGLPREAYRLRPLLHTDRIALALLLAGLGMLACGLDQGNRLDWWQSPLIVFLLCTGLAAVLAYGFHALRARHDRLLNTALLARWNITTGAWNVVPFGLAATGCGYLIPQYLGQIQGYRPEQQATVLWDAAWPQLISYTFAVLCLQRRWTGLGPRRLLALGFLLVGGGLLYDSLHLCGDWIAPQLRPGQMAQGLGLPLILLPLLFLYVGDLLPREALHAAMIFNVMRIPWG